MNTINSKEEGYGTLSNDNNDAFDPDFIPAKIPLVTPHNRDTGMTAIAYHTEAPFAIRKILLERAAPHFEEMANLDVQKVLVLSNERTQAMYDHFE